MKNNKPGLEIIKRYFPLELQISKKQWDFYEFHKIIPETGLKLPDYHALRLIVKKIYEKKDLKGFSHQPIRAGELNAIGLLNEIYRYILNAYRLTKNPDGFEDAQKWLEKKLSLETLNTTTKIFIELFPPHSVLFNKKSMHEYITDKTDELPNIQIILKELIILYLANNNPAIGNYVELFNDIELRQKSSYNDTFQELENFFKTQPPYGPKNQPIIELLKEPIKASPYSLKGQLFYIKENWHSILHEELLYRILLALDILKEEEKLGWLGPGPALVPSFKGLEEYQEYEQYTIDKDWMSKVVLIAKHTYVWLDQLSKKYGRWINKLDQIPDEELDILAKWGFTGLWLIGIWERSPASQKIKQWCGNPEALASAYSIYDYKISQDLGGEEALENLKARAWRRGIRLAADIVPNHTGIYSKWVIEHPDWFIQLPYPPFPSYSFTGGDLSDDPRVCIQIEDGYWNRRDAAVVFKRLDKWTGDTRYIYHGNDGTSMPWNDTAQLNFLRPDVREAVIQTILGVAKKFQIIRLDAAMTLTKKHYQRLWFPHPGTGGGIPSRAEHGMLKSDFDRLMPKEFWREVVDRVNLEVPDTLLIAEAFWLMEGYFVRTLGMHRVYNSAFMNMLKMEENEKYRWVIKNVLEFDPQILKRFVNFMNNPDELTAIEQFGKGDKYFGVCLMMVTMPGLPMFGHGQIEGFSEKYGMEYRRAYWDEKVDWDLVRRHEHEIFPLMRKRHLFSGVENFVLYDFFRPDGRVNENVFAYSNRCGTERALIVYNNKYEHASGWIRTSCAFSVPTGKPGEKKLIQKTLAEGLGIRNDPNYYYIFRDHKTGLEYIRRGSDIANNGLYIELGAYQYHAFIDFREVQDTHLGYYNRITNYLNGRGVPNVEDALKDLILSPIHTPFRELIKKETLEKLLLGEKAKFKDKTIEFLRATKGFINSDADESKITADIMDKLDAILRFKNAAKPPYVLNKIPDEIKFWKTPLIWLITHNIGRLRVKEDYESQSVALLDELLLGKVILSSLKEYEYTDWDAKGEEMLIRILSSYPQGEFSKAKIKQSLNDYLVQNYLNFNQFEGVLWFNKERFETLLFWFFIISIINSITPNFTNEEILKELQDRYTTLEGMLELIGKSDYKVDNLLKLFE